MFAVVNAFNSPLFICFFNISKIPKSKPVVLVFSKTIGSTHKNQFLNWDFKVTHLNFKVCSGYSEAIDNCPGLGNIKKWIQVRTRIS